MMSNETYFGDGAYGHVDKYGNVVITANHHDPRSASDVVVFEPAVLRAFKKWIEEVVESE